MANESAMKVCGHDRDERIPYNSSNQVRINAIIPTPIRSYLKLRVHVEMSHNAHFLLVQQGVQLLHHLHIRLQVVGLRLCK